MTNHITINLTKEQIIIKISENSNQKEIKECLNEKVLELKRLYQQEKTPILITGKILKNVEMEEIRNIIEKSIDVKIDFDSPHELGLYGIKRTFDKEIKSSETQYYKGSLRSGQKLEYEGSIVVLGDVNGGAEVVAGENIVVLGNLRGLAHAGAKGNKKAIISAVNIESPQLRIANILKEMEKAGENTKISYVYVKGNEIVLE